MSKKLDLSKRIRLVLKQKHAKTTKRKVSIGRKFNKLYQSRKYLHRKMKKANKNYDLLKSLSPTHLENTSTQNLIQSSYETI